MKKYATYLFTYTLCLAIGLISAYGQDISKFEYHGKAKTASGKNAYFYLDRKNVIERGSEIGFIGIATYEKDGKPDTEQYVVSFFVTNCKTYEAKTIKRYAMVKGKKGEDQELEDGERDYRLPPKDSVLDLAVRKVCGKGLVIMAVNVP